MAIPVVKFSTEGDKIRNEMKWDYMRIGVVVGCPKLGIILESKGVQKLSENVNHKKCASKLIFFNLKKNWERFGYFFT